MKNIPILLIAFRFLLGPVLITLTYNYGSEIRKELIVLIFLGLLSDIFDGIMARRLGKLHQKNLEGWTVRPIWFFGFVLRGVPGC